MSAEVEAVIWCPRCRIDKYEIRRIPTGAEGVHRHMTYPESIPSEDRKACRCGALLERKP